MVLVAGSHQVSETMFSVFSETELKAPSWLPVH